MNQPDPNTITRLLKDVRAGDEGASESLLPLVYEQLHGLAGAIFASESSGHTLQPTALVHEAWMKLANHLADGETGFEDRRHFYVVAARAMRRVLTDHARKLRSQKRGEGAHRVTFDEVSDSGRTFEFGLVDLDDSLAQLSRRNARHAQVVELRILGGLTIAETAKTLGVSHTTVEDDWFTAKAWMRAELGGTA